MMRNSAFQMKLCPVWSSVKDKKEGKMYGILLESVQFFVIKDVGEDIWHKVLEHAGMKNIVFSTHCTYSDELMVKLATSCCHVTKQRDFNQWMTFFGTCFVEFCSLYGYDNLLRVSGRYYRDFLHGIDNIHEIIRFSYPRLQSPSFLVLFEDKEGCVLLYQSKRRGFKHYVKGQLSQIAKKFYKVVVTITIIEEDFTDNICSVKFRLDFDNSVYSLKSVPAKISGNSTFSSITGDTFLKVFPFCVIFNNQLIIKNVGHSMAAFLRGDNLIGCHLREKFHIRRPLIPCIWNRILRFQRVIFELEYLQDDSDLSDLDLEEGETCQDKNVRRKSKSDNQKCLLRGEMKYIDDWDMVAFLCTPLLNNLKDLQNAGLFINDLNMFDMSRDMVMAGWQHASQLEWSIEQQRDKSEKISENMTKIEEWKKKSDSLLYSMIPQSIAERLKSGMNPIDTCQLFDMVTIMFVYMVGFADICTSSSPMEIVKCINNLFVEFDHIVDQYDVFKVETLGDAVYMVAGGVPDRNSNHAVNVATVALKLQERAKVVIRQIGRDNLNTRIGMHSGSVVGGVVGRRMPQYCLFGDSVNTASRMQTYSMPGRIHVSEPCNDCLKGSKLITVKRGKVNVKGKGEMQTFWLIGEEGDVENPTILVENLEESPQTLRKTSSYENALDLYGMHASTSYAQIELKTGNQRSSDTPTFSQLNSQQSLSILHENVLPKRDQRTVKKTDLETRSKDLNVDLQKDDISKEITSPMHGTTEEKYTSVKKDSTTYSYSDTISFFLDNAEADNNRHDDCDEGAINGADNSEKDDCAVEGNANYNDNVGVSMGAVGWIDSTATIKSQQIKNKNYAKSEEILTPQSKVFDKKDESDSSRAISVFCPFMSTVNSSETSSFLTAENGASTFTLPISKSQVKHSGTTVSGKCDTKKNSTVTSTRLEVDKVIDSKEQMGSLEQKSSPTMCSVSFNFSDLLNKTKEERSLKGPINSENRLHQRNNDKGEQRNKQLMTTVGSSKVYSNQSIGSDLVPSSFTVQDHLKPIQNTGEQQNCYGHNAFIKPRSIKSSNSKTLSEIVEGKDKSVCDKMIEKTRRICWIPGVTTDQLGQPNGVESATLDVCTAVKASKGGMQSNEDADDTELTSLFESDLDLHKNFHKDVHTSSHFNAVDEHNNTPHICNGLSSDSNMDSVLYNGHGLEFQCGNKSSNVG